MPINARVAQMTTFFNTIVGEAIGDNNKTCVCVRRSVFRNHTTTNAPFFCHHHAHASG